MSREALLLADDEPLSRDFLAEALATLGFDVHAVVDGQQAIDAMRKQAFDFVVTDLRMPNQDGNAVLAASKAQDPDRPVVLVTAHGTMGTAIEALRGGADDILEKPASLHDLELMTARIRERRRLLRENRYFRAESVGDDMVVAGPKTQAVVALVERIARSKATVLIRGESGTGKERVAALLHRCSDRREKPFVKVNCAALPEALMESELFGHEQGAFTGAGRRREGRFELADGGTLFLDEIGETTPAMQSKLLRVLQEGEFQRVGGTKTVKVDVRVVAATNRDLWKDVQQGRFREDLYYRLDVVPITLPPLREREEEIVPLAKRFLRKGLTLTRAAENALREWRWPGNVRELQNVLQRASLLAEGDVVDAPQLRSWLRNDSGDASKANASDAGAGISGGEVGDAESGDPIGTLVGRRLDEVTDELVLRTLQRHNGNRTKTAEVLGIGVRTLFNRLRELQQESPS
jgi:two-component system response regulator AtoC